MAKQFFTNGTGAQQTLTPSQNEKVAVYDTVADAEADLANLSEGQIVATNDTGDELAQPVDVVESGNLHAVSSNAVYQAINSIQKYKVLTSNEMNALLNSTQSNPWIATKSGIIFIYTTFLNEAGNHTLIFIDSTKNYYCQFGYASTENSASHGGQVIIPIVKGHTYYCTSKTRINTNNIYGAMLYQD